MKNPCSATCFPNWKYLEKVDVALVSWVLQCLLEECLCRPWNYCSFSCLQFTALFSLMSSHQSADKPSQLSETQLWLSLGSCGKFVMLGMWGHVQYGLQAYFQKQNCVSVAFVLLNIDFLSAVLEVRKPPGNSSWGFAWCFYDWSTIFF